MNTSAFITPLVILVWIGFLVCLGFFLTAKFARSTFQRRMQETVAPTEEAVEDLLEEQREVEMSQSLAQRLLGPGIKKFGGMMKGQAQAAGGAQIKDMLEQAGHPLGMGYSEFLGLKMFMLVLLAGLAVVSSIWAVPIIINLAGEAAASKRLILTMLWIMIFAYVGYSGPTFWLRYYLGKRLKQIRKSMADVVDLIVLSIEAGLGFDMAVGEAVSKTKGPLTDELRRVLDEVRVGRPQSEAFRSMAERVKMPELTLLVAAIDQATKMGVGLGKALRLQAQEIREKRMAFVREQAGKLPVKMMLPLVFFIFPALMVVILGPAAVQMMEMSASGEMPF